jgi:mono/diheme cytochrome c family protein
VYAALCIGCHGPTGAGIGGIDLRQGPLPRASTDAALTALLAKGVPGTTILRGPSGR